MLAAVLIATDFKLASPKIFVSMKRAGRAQLIPFLITILAIVFTDLLVGVVCGLASSLFFILQSNARRPLRKTVEKHMGGDIVRIELAPKSVSLIRQFCDARWEDSQQLSRCHRWTQHELCRFGYLNGIT